MDGDGQQLRSGQTPEVSSDTAAGIERKASAEISSEKGEEEADRERKSAHTTGSGTPRPRQLVVTACAACSSLGYELGDKVSAAPSPKGTGNRAHVLRYKQHMHMQPRSPAAALGAAAGDRTRASAAPLAREAGDEEAALRPHG